MKNATTQNFHVPLPPRLHKALRAVAQRQGRPATQLAREAIAEFIRDRRRREIEDELRAYVAAEAGGPEDLDELLEKASVEHLAPRRRRR